jgi:hypothetical protein
LQKPVKAAEGMLLVAFLGSAGQFAGFGAPAGWTKRKEKDANPSVVCFSKIAGASEPASYTFTHANKVTGGFIVALNNMAFDVAGNVVYAGNGVDLDVEEVTVATDNSVILTFISSQYNLTSPVAPLGMVEVISDDEAANPQQYLHYEWVNSGLCGNRNFGTTDAGGTWHFMIACSPA